MEESRWLYTFRSGFEKSKSFKLAIELNYIRLPQFKIICDTRHIFCKFIDNIIIVVNVPKKYNWTELTWNKSRIISKEQFKKTQKYYNYL